MEKNLKVKRQTIQRNHRFGKKKEFYFRNRGRKADRTTEKNCRAIFLLKRKRLVYDNIKDK